MSCWCDIGDYCAVAAGMQEAALATYDWIRYVPDRKGFQEGSYEAVNTRCGPGGGEALTDAAIRCLLELHEAPQQTIRR